MKTWATLNSAPNAEKSINFQIEYQCPQCGAPAILDETDRLFTCAFCRVKSYLMPTDFFRYMLPNNAPVEKELIYFPYWRFKGMLFSCLHRSIENRFLDVSHQAAASLHFPVSVGLRSQAMKLRFVTPEIKGNFIKPLINVDQAMDIILERFSVDLPKPILHQARIGESISMIYAPFYADSKLHDAILNQPITGVL
ncbi:MAG: hypothetical protein HKM93_00700, partial [Desulfobacteraceae bacterium]|nr:hypothetical protein [Desulfobacteraceae bacterium]